jgi:hypothetical protein
VVELIHSASAPLLGPEFDDFLFAPIGEERTGMRLSVLSALARRKTFGGRTIARRSRRGADGGFEKTAVVQRHAAAAQTLPG